jgi:hypothetical protein
MYEVGSRIQIINHSEPSCNLQYGTITHITVGYDGYTKFYTVELDDTHAVCMCIDDELMEE